MKTYLIPELEKNVVPSKIAFGEALVALGKQIPNLVVCDADLMRAAGTDVFRKAYPDRHFNFGVAEQNMVAAAAGLAISGKTVFATTFANFATKRACDQMSISVAYNQANVKLCGTYAGLTCEKNGGTHISVEDVSIMRAMPNVIVVEPADPEELAQATRAVAEYEGPVYLRIPKIYYRNLFGKDYTFEIGRAAQLGNGTDISLCACGLMTGVAWQAAEELLGKGISASVFNFSTIKPLDVEAVRRAAATGAILTVENHSVIGGLGSAIMECLSEYRQNPKIRRLGLQDVFGKTASLDWLLSHNGLAEEQIVTAAEELLREE